MPTQTLAFSQPTISLTTTRWTILTQLQTCRASMLPMPDARRWSTLPIPNSSAVRPLRTSDGMPVLAIITMAVAMGFAVRQWSRSRVPNLQTAEITKLTDSGTAAYVAISPDGRYVVYALREGGKLGLWVRQVATRSDVQILAPDAVDFQGLSFSPDGNYIYFVPLANSLFHHRPTPSSKPPSKSKPPITKPMLPFKTSLISWLLERNLRDKSPDPPSQNLKLPSMPLDTPCPGKERRGASRRPEESFSDDSCHFRHFHTRRTLPPFPMRAISAIPMNSPCSTVPGMARSFCASAGGSAISPNVQSSM